MAAPDLWDDQPNAQRVTGRLSALQGDLDRFTNLQQRLDDVETLVELSQEESDAESMREAEAELRKVHKAVEALEVRTLLSGEYDAREALLTIRSGAGGVDAADFAEMLMRMYTRWAERNKYSVEVFDTSYAEEAGLKSATFAIHAPYAYGTLSVESGTHRLVRISPFDNQGRRQTSFAAVEVVPVLEQTDEIEIPDEEIRVDVYRSSGPGGQSVNTTDSAVRLTHIPTGIVVSCQNEKSQLQNKASAMVILKAKLLALKKAEERAEIDELRGDVQGSWGDQMRNYVLHPYQMVKDLRTDYETGNTQAVFDGEIDAFLEAGIRWRRGADSAARGLGLGPSRRHTPTHHRWVRRTGSSPGAGGTRQLAGQPGVAEQPAQRDRATTGCAPGQLVVDRRRPEAGTVADHAGSPSRSCLAHERAAAARSTGCAKTHSGPPRRSRRGRCSRTPATTSRSPWARAPGRRARSAPRPRPGRRARSRRRPAATRSQVTSSPRQPAEVHAGERCRGGLRPGRSRSGESTSRTTPYPTPASTTSANATTTRPAATAGACGARWALDARTPANPRSDTPDVSLAGTAEPDT